MVTNTKHQQVIVVMQTAPNNTNTYAARDNKRHYLSQEFSFHLNEQLNTTVVSTVVMK